MQVLLVLHNDANLKISHNRALVALYNNMILLWFTNLSFYPHNLSNSLILTFSRVSLCHLQRYKHKFSHLWTWNVSHQFRTSLYSLGIRIFFEYSYNKKLCLLRLKSVADTQLTKLLISLGYKQSPNYHQKKWKTFQFCSQSFLNDYQSTCQVQLYFTLW